MENLINITVEDTSYPVQTGTTLAQLRDNQNFRNIFGVSDSHTLNVNGTTAVGSHVLQSGDRITMQAAACSKA